MDHDTTHVDIAIVGSGFSGMGMAIRLKEHGFEDFTILERAGEVGGTWQANNYPGCGCDVPSHLYSFSFAPNPAWTRTYSRQPEIRDYLRRCSERFGLEPHLRLNTEVTSAAWDEDACRWDLETSQGPVCARVLVAGMGPLSDAKVPDLPGLDCFEGEVFHSARWNHDYDLAGKRVASIGTGASAIQYVPSIQPEVERLHVFQRTPPWILPHTDRPTTRLERTLYRLAPPLQRLVRGGIYAARETAVLGFVKHPKVMPLVERLAKRHMRKQLSDPALIEKVTPDYTIGCKRILPSNRALAVIDVNLLGAWRVTAAALPALREAGGRVVNVASGLAHVAVPFATAYCMSKRGLVGYSDALRLEHGDRVGVTTVYPGYIRTRIHESAGTSRHPSLRATSPRGSGTPDGAE